MSEAPERLAAARQAAARALRDARERQLIHHELAALETYTDAWGRYALALESSLHALSPVGHGQRPHPLPPATTVPAAPSDEPNAEELCAGIAADLQCSLGAQQWSWHGAHAGENAVVPLSWLRQIDEGVKLLRSAAVREAALRARLADAQVRADAAEEQRARDASSLKVAEEELAMAEARIRELEGSDASARNTFDSEGDDAAVGRGMSEDYDAYEPFGAAGASQADGGGVQAQAQACGGDALSSKGNSGSPSNGGGFWKWLTTSTASPRPTSPVAHISDVGTRGRAADSAEEAGPRDVDEPEPDLPTLDREVAWLSESTGTPLGGGDLAALSEGFPLGVETDPRGAGGGAAE